MGKKSLYETRINLVENSSRVALGSDKIDDLHEEQLRMRGATIDLLQRSLGAEDRVFSGLKDSVAQCPRNGV